MKRFFDFILFGNIYVALGAVFLIQSTVVQFNLSSPLFYYSAFVFFATVFIYNLQRIFYKKTENKSHQSIRRIWIFRNQNLIKILTVIGFAGMTILFFFNDIRILVFLSPLFVLSIAYFFPLVKLRNNAWVKLFTLALVWTLTTALVPILLKKNMNMHLAELIWNYYPENYFRIVLHISTRFCFMLAICIPFDLRDMKLDAEENIITLPQKFGEKRSRNLALSVTIIYGMLLISEYIFRITSLKTLVVLLINMVITLVFIMLSNSKRSEYFFVAGIDGMMILQGMMLILSSLFY